MGRAIRIVLMGGVWAAVAAPVVAAEEGAKPSGGKTVLVAAEASTYKKALVAKISEVVKARDCECKTVTLKELAAADVDSVSAVVVLTSYPEWRKGKSVTRLLGKHGDAVKAKLVVVTTARRTAWKAPVAVVDAITTASKVDNVVAIAGRIAKNLDTILAKQP